MKFKSLASLLVILMTAGCSNINYIRQNEGLKFTTSPYVNKRTDGTKAPIAINVVQLALPSSDKAQSCQHLAYSADDVVSQNTIVIPAHSEQIFPIRSLMQKTNYVLIKAQYQNNHPVKNCKLISLKTLIKSKAIHINAYGIFIRS